MPPLMTSLMQISQHADQLVVSYPWWIAVALLLLSAALLRFAVFGATMMRRRWIIGVATVVAAWAGLYFATFNATLTNEAGSVYVFLGHPRVVQWQDAKDIYLERRGREWRIVVLQTEKRPFELNVADLSVGDRDRIMAYMVDRMPENAFPRSPALLRRHAPGGPRPAGYLSDQQT